MTLLDRAAAAPARRAGQRAASVRLLESGVGRLSGAVEAPVILLPDLASEVSAAVAPLLARRRDVYVVDGGLVPGAVAPGVVAPSVLVPGGVVPGVLVPSALARALADVFAGEAVALVGGALAAAVADELSPRAASARGPRVELAAVVGPGSLPPALPMPTLLVVERSPVSVAGECPVAMPHAARGAVPPGSADPAAPGSADIAAAASASACVAESGHPVETAHLVDAFLREPGRFPAGARLERARP